MATRMTRAESAVAEAAAAVVEARQVLAQWQARIGDAQADLDRVEAAPGDVLLNDAESAAAWPARVRDLRDQVAVATRAASAQEQRVQAAERAWCGALAALIEDDEVTPSRKALAAHQERLRELLDLLEEHDGPYVPQHRLAQAQRGAGVLVEGAAPVRLPKEYALQVAHAQAQLRHDVVAAMAQGVDPAAVVAVRAFAGEISEDACYPDEVRATGLVPAPAYAARAAQARALVEELEDLPGQLEAEIAELPERAARERWEPGVLDGAVTRRRARLEEIPTELDAARGELAALTVAPARTA